MKIVRFSARKGMYMDKTKKVVVTIGKRKKAIAKAMIKEGNGKVYINKVPLDLLPRYRMLRIKEALAIAGTLAENVNITVGVRGGGSWGQTDAARTAIANGLVNFHKNKELKQKYVDYDRSLLISDARRTEPHKPSRSSAGPRRSKQQSKR